MELVDPGYAMVDEGGFGRGLTGVCRAKPSGTEKSILGPGVNVGGTGVVRCPPAISVSSVIFGT